MFANCSGLKKVGSLSATTLTPHCYNGLFENCYNLEYLPKLLAKQLTECCYRAIFYNCSKFGFKDDPEKGYTQEYRVPTEGIGVTADGALDLAIKKNLELNKTYYINDNVVII